MAALLVSDSRKSHHTILSALFLFFLSVFFSNPALANEVVSLTLVNAATDQDIRPLVNGDVVNIAVTGTSLNIRANVSGSVGSVRFGLDGNTNFRTESTAPYALAGDSSGNYEVWTPALGSHSLTATPYSASGATGTVGIPLSIGFTVTNAATSNRAPVITSGPQAAPNPVALPATTTVSVTASDADGDALTYAWSKSAGPGTVSFTNAAAASTTAAFSAGGSYTLQVVVSDGQATVSGSVNVSVISDPASSSQVVSLTLVNAATDQDIRPLVNGDVVNLAVTGTSLNIRANVSGSVGSVRFGLDGNTNFRTESTAPYALAGDSSGNYEAWTPALGSHSLTATPYSASGATGTVGIPLSIGFTVTNAATSNRVPVITSGPQAAPNPVALPATTTVSVTASDADGDALTYAWSKSAGPGTVSFTNAAAASTTAAFSAGGSYTLQVTVSDGRATISGSVSVTVLPGNRAPVISSGPQAAPNPVTLPATATVSVTASDADGDALTYAWSRTAGSGTVSFGNATAASTTAAFSAAGSYTLQVVVSDGKATVSGSVVISVSSSTGGGDTLLSTHFDSGSDQFTYNDDTFLGTSRPIYASGSYDAAGGFSGGGLRVTLGGVDVNSITNGMSGGWSRSLNLSASASVTINLRYRMQMNGGYEPDECSQVLLAVDGVLLGADQTNYLYRDCGLGDGYPDRDSGWRQAVVQIVLQSGLHTLTVGGWNNQKTYQTEITEIYFDDITVIVDGTTAVYYQDNFSAVRPTTGR